MIKDEAIKILSVLHLGHSTRAKDACDMAIRALLEQKPTGHWEEVMLDGELWYKCSNCGFTSSPVENFCPDCGADMGFPKGDK